jgi:hypothetical protein
MFCGRSYTRVYRVSEDFAFVVIDSKSPLRHLDEESIKANRRMHRLARADFSG